MYIKILLIVGVFAALSNGKPIGELLKVPVRLILGDSAIGNGIQKLIDVPRYMFHGFVDDLSRHLGHKEQGGTIGDHQYAHPIVTPYHGK